jgi:hypothetical protein
MKHLVSMLYAHIVRFLIRALKYYEESSIMRAVHSITKPAALRYNDLIKLIQRDEEMSEGMQRRAARQRYEPYTKAFLRSVLSLRKRRARLKSND